MRVPVSSSLSTLSQARTPDKTFSPSSSKTRDKVACGSEKFSEFKSRNLRCISYGVLSPQLSGSRSKMPSECGCREGETG